MALKDWVKSQLDSRPVLPAAPFLPRYVGDYLQDKDPNFGPRNIIWTRWTSAARAHKWARCLPAKYRTRRPGAGRRDRSGTAQNIAAVPPLLEQLQDIH